MIVLAIFFLGISIGSLNPLPPENIWGWIIPLTIGTIFMGFDIYFEQLERRQRKDRKKKEQSK